MSTRSDTQWPYIGEPSDRRTWIQARNPAASGYGVIFSDGIESDFLEFNVGMTATINLAEHEGHLAT
jgi:hypothetical protein